MPSVLDQLNAMQHEICKHINGPVLILAGAGSGKTRVLTHRIAYLILEHKIFPNSVLALTFTNKAAKEMRNRVEKLLGHSVSAMWIGTFHSIFARILRMEANTLGYNSSFTIYDSDDSNQVVKRILTEHEIPLRDCPPKQFTYYIAGKKDTLINATKMSYRSNFSQEELKDYIYYRYQETLKSNNAFDFNDLIVKAYELFSQHPEILEKYQEKFRYILVDEYQDTNSAQYHVVKLLSDKYKNVTVVGDEDQSIYSWRGADISNILNFSSDFENAKTFRLEQNYRSSDKILAAANALVKYNTARIGKNLWTNETSGEKILLFSANSESEEAFIVTKHILSECQRLSITLNDCVILYRTNAQSRPIEDVLRKQNIRYQIVGGLKFYDRKEIKDVIAYLRFICNPKDKVALERIINEPSRGIGDTSVDKLIAEANASNKNIYEVLLNVNKISVLSAAIKQKVFQFAEQITKSIEEKSKLNAFEFSSYILEQFGLIRSYELEQTIESEARLENLQEFLRSVQEFSQTSPEKSVEDYLQEIQLLSDLDTSNDDSEVLTLMTLHSAKGLEFPLVHIVGVEEGILPHFNSYDSPKKFEEERRLFYVGITRAEKKLVLSYCKARFSTYGGAKQAMASSFIKELPKEYIEFQDQKYKDKREYLNKQTSFIGKQDESDQTPKIKQGSLVEHDLFGKGVVKIVDGYGDNARLTVIFETAGIKKLVLKFANLKLIDYID